MVEVLSKAEREVARQGAAFKLLLDLPAWEIYLEVLQGQADTWGKLAVTPSQELFDLVKSEYAKGVLKGLGLAMTIPAYTVAQRKELLASHATPEGDENGDRTDDDDDEPELGAGPLHRSP